MLMVPVVMVQVGCTDTVPVGVVGNTGAALTVICVAMEIQPVTVFLTVTL